MRLVVCLRWRRALRFFLLFYRPGTVLLRRSAFVNHSEILMDCLGPISELSYFRHQVLLVLLIDDFRVAALILLLSMHLSVTPIHNGLVVVSAAEEGSFLVVRWRLRPSSCVEPSLVHQVFGSSLAILDSLQGVFITVLCPTDPLLPRHIVLLFTELLSC